MAQGGVLATAAVPADAPDALETLARLLGPGPFAKVVLFLSPLCDLARLEAGLGRWFAPGIVIGCTTAGEISDDGYTDGQIVAVGFPAAHFAVECLLVPDLLRLEPQDLIGGLGDALNRFGRRRVRALVGVELGPASALGLLARHVRLEPPDAWAPEG